MSLRKCIKCGLPETYETLVFDEKGICNVCNSNLFKKENINWDERHKMLEDLIEQYRGKYDYDCLIPFSGGKDSTYILYYLIKTFKIKPLVIQFDHGFMRPNLRENNERTFKKLGIDVLSFSPNWKIVKRLMLESLKRKGDFCWHCHTGITSYPMQVAIKHNIPLIFWGEPSSEYTAYYSYEKDEIEEVNEEKVNRIANLGITAEDMFGMLKDNSDLEPRDLLPYSYPKLRDLKKLGYRSVCLGSFIPWDTRKHYEIINKELGWKGDQVEGMPDGVYPYEKIECYMQGVRDYLKYLKRGYSRVTQMTALDLRNNLTTKEEAEALIATTEGKRPPSLDLFLSYVGLTEDDFNKIVEYTVVSPHKPDFSAIEIGKKTWDYDRWFREEP